MIRPGKRAQGYGSVENNVRHTCDVELGGSLLGRETLSTAMSSWILPMFSGVGMAWLLDAGATRVSPLSYLTRGGKDVLAAPDM